MRRLPIRWRLVATSVLLVLAVLLVTAGAVLWLERRALDDALAAQARAEAESLLAVAAHADGAVAAAGGSTGVAIALGLAGEPDAGRLLPVDDDPELGEREEDERDDERDDEPTVPDLPEPQPGTVDGLDSSTQPYLLRRSASSTLLAVRAPDGTTLLNAQDAAALVPLLGADAERIDVDVDGDPHIASVVRDASGITAAAAVPTDAAEERMEALVRALLLAGGFGLILTVGLGWLAARGALRPLEEMSASAEGITAARLDARLGPAEGADEIARLTRTIDSMLDRLEGAFAAQRRFVQDASHELRTPITIARGHLEVVDPAREEPADVQAALDLAVAELDRMGRLVERLLVLARAGEIPAEARTRELAVDLAEDALTRSRDDSGREWRLEVEAPHARVLVDRDAIVDALVNLLVNAQRHTTASGSIAVRVEASDGRVRLVVADDGEGIPSDVLPTVFDRFTRADAARSRDSGGAGLGLAICRACVEAHGGRISAASAPGRGAVFTIDLPAAP